MKQFLTITLIFLTILTNAQDYKLFNATSKKLFSRDSSVDTTFSIEFDSVKIAGTDSIYYNHTGVIDNYIQPDVCTFWGGPFCLPQTRPSGTGITVIADNIGSYRFITCLSDTLTFNFDLLQGDSSLIYQDITQRFYIVYEGTDTAFVLTVADSVRLYRIKHTDASGNTINSPLNNEMIRIGKNFGMIDFVRVDYFPLILQSLKLIGNISPDAGLTTLTHGILYDYHPDDVIQYIDRFFNPAGPPQGNYQKYIKYRFLNRTNTQDSIIYLVERVVFEMGASTQITDTIYLRYKRATTIDKIPFDHINQSSVLSTSRLYKADYCGLNLWTYKRSSSNNMIYCIQDNCWGNFDTNGPPPQDEITYVCGLGIYNIQSTVISPLPAGYSSMYGIIYFKKNGVACGKEAIVSINEPEIQHNVFNVFPNPSQNELFIKTEKNNEGTVYICNLVGQQIIKSAITGIITTIDVSKLAPGVYMVKLINGSYSSVKKIIKE